MRGDDPYLTRSIGHDLFQDSVRPDRVYGSAIFSFSAHRVAQFMREWPEAIVGGTHNLLDNSTVEQIIGEEEYEHYDYSIYTRFKASIGFTARGCRLKCGFCVVPKKEGKPRSVNTIADIWRGDPYPKNLHLLDNDFFGQAPEQWQARIAEIQAGGYKVCLNQGINVRMINDESATALASIPLYDDQFEIKRLYTAWDNIGDEGRFFRGVDCLERHGIKPSMLMVYMLCGYAKDETWERLLYRFDRMRARKILPYPMVYGDPTRCLEPEHPTLAKKTLRDFQRWGVGRYYNVISFEKYDSSARHKLAKINGVYRPMMPGDDQGQAQMFPDEVEQSKMP